MSSFKDLRIVDNFYQSSAYFPMPTILISTLDDEACAMLVKLPRVFLKLVLNGCVKYAKEHGISIIDEKVMKEINDKRKAEKERK